MQTRRTALITAAFTALAGLLLATRLQATITQEPYSFVINPLSPLSDPSNGTPKRPTRKATS